MAFQDTETLTLTIDQLKEFEARLPGLETKFYTQTIVEMVAREGMDNDWAAYVDTPNGSAWEYQGYKLTHEVAKELFPTWDEKLIWRK